MANAAEEKRSGLISSVKGAVGKVRGKAGKAVDSATGRVGEVYDTSKVRRRQQQGRGRAAGMPCQSDRVSRVGWCAVTPVPIWTHALPALLFPAASTVLDTACSNEYPG